MNESNIIQDTIKTKKKKEGNLCINTNINQTEDNFNLISGERFGTKTQNYYRQI